MDKKDSALVYYALTILTGITFFLLTREPVLMDLIDSNPYVYYGFIGLYIFYICIQFLFRNEDNSVKYYLIIIVIWIIFILFMTQAVLMRIIDTKTYILYGFVVLYILYIYVQLMK